jgi:hypothetical protein
MDEDDDEDDDDDDDDDEDDDDDTTGRRHGKSVAENKRRPAVGNARWVHQGTESARRADAPTSTSKSAMFRARARAKRDKASASGAAPGTRDIDGSADARRGSRRPPIRRRRSTVGV